MPTEATIALGLIAWGVLALMVSLICTTWMEGTVKRARDRGEREHKAGIYTPDTMEEIDGVHMSMGAGTAVLLLACAASPFLAPMSLLFAWFAPLWARLVTGVVTFVVIMFATSSLISDSISAFKPDGKDKAADAVKAIGKTDDKLMITMDSTKADEQKAAGRSGGRSLGKVAMYARKSDGKADKDGAVKAVPDGTMLNARALMDVLRLDADAPEMPESGEIQLNLVVSSEPATPKGVTATVSEPVFPDGYEVPARARKDRWDARTIVPMIAKEPGNGRIIMDGSDKATLEVSFADSSGTDGTECYAVVVPVGDGTSMLAAFTKEGSGEGTEMVGCPVDEATVVVDSKCGTPTATPFHRFGRMTGMKLVVPTIETIRKAGLVIAMLDHPDDAMNAMGQRLCQVLGVPTKDGDVVVLHEGKGLATVEDEHVK